MSVAYRHFVAVDCFFLSNRLKLLDFSLTIIVFFYTPYQKLKLFFLFSIVYDLDIDECITGNHDCDVNANCTNTVGGHNCTCKEGFAGDGRSCLSKLYLCVNLNKL